jgi:hypothetical protein
VEGQRHRHLSIRSLALLAQRTGQVFASVRTWYASVRANGWRRLRAHFADRDHRDRRVVITALGAS